jgi:anti-anti-sigma factor
VLVVHTPDEMCHEQVDRFGAFMGAQQQSQIVLDMGQTEMLDSDGLTALVDAQDKLRADGGDLKIATANGINRKILEMTRLDQRLEVYETVVDAVNSFQ